MWRRGPGQGLGLHAAHILFLPNRSLQLGTLDLDPLLVFRHLEWSFGSDKPIDAAAGAGVVSEEHRLGSLIFTVASLSTGNYLLIQNGKRREWWVFVRSGVRKHSATSETLVDALQQAWQWLQGSRGKGGTT